MMGNNKKIISTCFLLLCLSKATSVSGKQEQEVLTFEDFVELHDKSYDSTKEYERRKLIFDRNMERIQRHNQNKDSLYKMAPNHMMDLERPPMGYNKNTAYFYNKNKKLKQQQQLETSISRRRRLGRRASDSNLLDLPFEISHISDLPVSVDWRDISTPVKDQGGCGSCWAFASTAVLESHVAIQTKTLFTLSTQELVSCAPNPQECGGTGGCMGSTAPLAYDYVTGHGVLEEDQFGYQSYEGADIPCKWATTRSKLDGGMIPSAVATIDGYISLPTNNYTVLLNAIAKVGPIAMSVAADDWQFYDSGIFDAPLDSPDACDINHLVVLVGYDQDEDGTKYWLVRNSWSPRWGEGGYIRLLRKENDDENCGMDTTPGDGDACEIDDNGNPIDPSPEKICGTSGLLYSGVFPTGAKLV